MCKTGREDYATPRATYELVHEGVVDRSDNGDAFIRQTDGCAHHWKAVHL